MRQLFPDSWHKIYKSIFLNVTADDNITRDDLYKAIADATEAARDSHIGEMDYTQLLYMFEFHIIYKVGGINSPCVCI